MEKESGTRKLNEMIGAVKAFTVTSNFVNAARYGLYKQIRDGELYKLLGKDWKMFCQEDLGRDQKTVNDEIRMLEEFGESFLLAAERIGLKKKDLYALDKSFSIADKISIKDGNLMDGARKIPLTKEHHGEVADLLTKLVDKTIEAESQAAQAKRESEAKYNTSKAWEKKYQKTQKELDDALRKQEIAERELGFMMNPEYNKQQTFLGAVEKQFKYTFPLFLFIENNVSQIEKFRNDKENPKAYPPKCEVSLRTLIKYIFELSRLYFNKLEMLVADTEQDMIDPKYVSGLEREVKEDWANTIWPGAGKAEKNNEGEENGESQS